MMISIMKLFLLTTPLWIGFICGIAFPFYGLTLSTWAFSFLFVLGLLNTFPFQFAGLRSVPIPWKRLGFFLFVGYSFFPGIQMLLAKFFVSDPSYQLGILMGSLAP